MKENFITAALWRLDAHSMLIFRHEVTSSYQFFNVRIILSARKVLSLLFVPTKTALTMGCVRILLRSEKKDNVKNTQLCYWSEKPSYLSVSGIGYPNSPGFHRMRTLECWEYSIRLQRPSEEVYCADSLH